MPQIFKAFGANNGKQDIKKQDQVSLKITRGSLSPIIFCIDKSTLDILAAVCKD